MNKDKEIKEKIRKQILMGGGETLVDAIYLIFEDIRQKDRQDFKRVIEEMKRKHCGAKVCGHFHAGDQDYNQALSDILKALLTL